MADIEPLHDNWGAKANDATFIAIWVSPEGNVSWTKANTTLHYMAMIAAILNTWVSEWIRKDLI